MKKLKLNKIKISKIDNLDQIRGGVAGDTLQEREELHRTVGCPTVSCDCPDNTNNTTLAGEVTQEQPFERG